MEQMFCIPKNCNCHDHFQESICYRVCHLSVRQNSNSHNFEIFEYKLWQKGSMVVSSDGGNVQNRSILYTVNCDRLFLRNECLPVLKGITKLQPSRVHATTSGMHLISQFVLESQKCPDIELYWTQATKL